MKMLKTIPMAFLTGILTGMAAGVLFAPNKGKITRTRLKNELRKNKELAEEK